MRMRETRPGLNRRSVCCRVGLEVVCVRAGTPREAASARCGGVEGGPGGADTRPHPWRGRPTSRFRERRAVVVREPHERQGGSKAAPGGGRNFPRVTRARPAPGHLNTVQTVRYRVQFSDAPCCGVARIHMTQFKFESRRSRGAEQPSVGAAAANDAAVSELARPQDQHSAEWRRVETRPRSEDRAAVHAPTATPVSHHACPLQKPNQLRAAAPL
jgi:hypothetical protein